MINVTCRKARGSAVVSTSACHAGARGSLPGRPGTVLAESLDIERRHMAALTWDAMFKSRRAAILADGGVI